MRSTAVRLIPGGRQTTIEPAGYRSFEGKDISDQEKVKRILKRHKPVLSEVFRSVEGYDAVDAEKHKNAE